MRMRVPFGQVEAETDQHRHEGYPGRPSTPWLTEADGDTGGDERRDREDRRRTRCPDAALREQIQAQAQTVAGGTAHEKPDA
jgi:hypothetical protein